MFWDFKTLDASMIGGITRTVVFVFKVTNASPLWLGTTGNVKGDIIVLAHRLLGAPWKVTCDGIAPESEGEIRIVFPVSETFAKTLAYKPKDGYFYANFSEMHIEFETKDKQHKYTLGYMPIPVGQIDVTIKDHTTFQKLRKVVEWEDSLGEDKRITK